MNNSSNKTGIAIVSSGIALLIGLPIVVLANPGSSPPTGNVNANFNSVQTVTDGTIGGNLMVDGTSMFVNDVTAKNNLIVNGTSNLVDVISTGTGSFDKDLTSKSNLDISGIGIFGGTLTAADIVSQGTGVFGGNVTVTGDVSASNMVYVQNAIQNKAVAKAVKIADDQGVEISNDGGAPSLSIAANGNLSNASGPVAVYDNDGFASYASGPTATPAITGTSVHGPGVQGTSTNDYGVRGNGKSGVLGIGTTGNGVQAVSTDGYGLQAISTNNYGLVVSSINSTAVNAGSSNAPAIYASSLHDYGLRAASTNGTGILSTGLVNAGVFNNTAWPTNTVSLATASEAINATGSVTLKGHAKINSLGGYTRYTGSLTTVTPNNSGSATVSCAKPSEFAISCNFTKNGSASTDYILNGTALTPIPNPKTCTVSFYNNNLPASGLNVAITPIVYCFDTSV